MKAILTLLLTLATLPAIGASNETRLRRRERVWLGTPMSTGLDVAFMMTQYPNFRDQGGAFANAPMKGGRVALEWVPFGEAAFGKLGFGIAAGYLASENKTINGAERHLTVIPTEAYLAYRADFFHQQLFVPFGKIGTNVSFYKNPDNVWYAYPGLDWAVGLEICLSHLEPSAARELDNNFGINDAYLLVEYVRSEFLGQWRNLDLRNEAVRVALRFEM